jgi:excinuclease ABC subunit A
MSVESALDLFANVPRIRRILQTLHDVGLGYIPLGQAAPTLSGGEAQRVKLAAELARPDTGKTLYILDEPTTGLHFDDVRKLLEVVHRLADLGNTVVVIEHNLEVIKTADWVIDLGPEAGAGGGELVAVGTPEMIVQVKRSHTGRFLKSVLAAGPLAERPKFDPKTTAQGRPRGTADQSEKVKAPWERDGRKWHTGGRPASNGRPTRWDGRLLDWIVSQVEALAASDSRLVPTDWSERNVVRIVSSDHDTIRYPFFHATTSSEWVITLRFFVPKNTFSPRALEDQFGLVPFHQSSPPVLCDQPRVKTTNAGPFQLITIVGYSAEEFKTPSFESFLRKAVAAFLNIGKPSKIKKASELA